MTGSNVFSFLTGKRAVIYDKVHRDSRFGNSLEWNRFWIFRRTQRIPDVNIRNTGDCYDGTDAGFFYFDTVQSLKFIQFTDFYFIILFRIVGIYDHNILIDAHGTVVHFSDTDTADIFIVIDRTDKNLGIGIRISGWSRNIIYNRIKQRFHISSRFFIRSGSNSLFGRSKDKWAVKLLLIGIEVNEKFQNLIDNFSRTSFRTVDLIDTDNDRKAEFQRFFQYKFCLRHRPFKGIDYKNDTVYHFEDTFYFAAEISMSRGINNIYFNIIIMNGCIFRKDGNTTFSFNIIGVHNTFRNFLIFSEDSALFEQFIHDGCFSVIDVGNDCNISYIIS